MTLTEDEIKNLPAGAVIECVADSRAWAPLGYRTAIFLNNKGTRKYIDKDGETLTVRPGRWRLVSLPYAPMTEQQRDNLKHGDRVICISLNHVDDPTLVPEGKKLRVGQVYEIDREHRSFPAVHPTNDRREHWSLCAHFYRDFALAPADAAAEPKPAPRPLFIVWNPHGPYAPRVKHSTEAEAVTAAERMAKRHPDQTFYVMRAVASFVGTVHATSTEH